MEEDEDLGEKKKKVQNLALSLFSEKCFLFFEFYQMFLFYT